MLFVYHLTNFAYCLAKSSDDVSYNELYYVDPGERVLVLDVPFNECPQPSPESATVVLWCQLARKRRDTLSELNERGLYSLRAHLTLDGLL